MNGVITMEGWTREAVRPLVGDLRQLASVRRIVLDDGAERGVRALAFSTGGGLDFWVLTDRSFDIGPVWFRGTPLAWQGPNGFRSPALHDGAGDDGRGFMRSFSGFLVTCGLDHVRQPRNGHPLHGNLPFTPGRLKTYGEDWQHGQPVLFCEGEVTQARFDGEALRLHRRIEAPIGSTTIRIFDRVENLAPADQDHDILYHLNLGFPMLTEKTRIHHGEERVAFGADDAPTILCSRADRTPRARCSAVTPCEDGSGGLAVKVSFETATLPFLQIWRDMRPHRFVTALEPCTSDRLPDGTSAPGPGLAPLETRSYSLQVDLTVDGSAVGPESVEARTASETGARRNPGEPPC